MTTLGKDKTIQTEFAEDRPRTTSPAEAIAHMRLIPRKVEDDGPTEAYLAPSWRGPGSYKVGHIKNIKDPEDPYAGWNCTCKGWEFGRRCKHIDAVQANKDLCDGFYGHGIAERGQGTHYAEGRLPGPAHNKILQLFQDRDGLMTSEMEMLHVKAWGSGFNRGRLSEVLGMKLLEMKKEYILMEKIRGQVPTFEYVNVQRYWLTPLGYTAMRRSME